LDPNDLSEANALNIMLLLDNMASGEYLEDMAILQRHLSQLAGHEQNTPNLTVRVEPGTAWFGLNSYVTFAGGNSPAIPAPAANPRRDIVTIRNDGNLYVLSGAEAAVPVPPAIPSTDVAICQVYCVVGMTKIRDNDMQESGQGYIEYDLRPLFQRPLGSDAMPKIGLQPRGNYSHSITSGDSGWLTALDYSGFGRVGSIRVIGSLPGINDSAQFYYRITVDGTMFINEVFSVVSGASPAFRGFEVLKAITSATASPLAAVETTPAAPVDTPKGVDLLFFKNGIKIEYRINNPGDPSKTKVQQIVLDWEHE
jgi:hypothetical protein